MTLSVSAPPGMVHRTAVLTGSVARPASPLPVRHREVYILSMRVVLRVSASLTSAALLAILLIAPFCAPAEARAHPCCDTSSGCGTGLQAQSCCRVEPAETHSAPAAQRRALPISGGDAGTFVWQSDLAEPVPVLAHRTAPALPAHGGPPPLYLQHSSILR